MDSWHTARTQRAFCSAQQTAAQTALRGASDDLHSSVSKQFVYRREVERLHRLRIKQHRAFDGRCGPEILIERL